MKIYIKSDKNRYVDDVGEAFIEISQDGDNACLSAIMNNTGKVVKYCKFSAKPEEPIDLSALNKNVTYTVQQLSDITGRIDKLERTQIDLTEQYYVGADSPDHSCIWFDSGATQ